ncbi:hypothetical protein ACFL3V_05730 [Nanoarchaeota archaeon]
MWPISAYKGWNLKRASKRHLAGALERLADLGEENSGLFEQDLEPLDDWEINKATRDSRGVFNQLLSLKEILTREISRGATLSFGRLEQTYLTGEDYETLESRCSEIKDKTAALERKAEEIIQLRKDERERIRKADREIIRPIRKGLERLRHVVEERFGPNLNQNIPFYIAEYQDAVAFLNSNISRAEGSATPEILDQIVDETRRSTLSYDLESVVERYRGLGGRLERGLEFKTQARDVIFNGKSDGIVRLLDGRGVTYCRPPPERLVHGVMAIRCDDSGSWSYAKSGSGHSSKNVLTPDEYVDVVEDILDEGIQASKRRHAKSDKEAPAVYFFDADRANPNSGDVGYGMVKIVLDTGDVDMPVFHDAGVDEYLVYAPKVAGNFRIELRYDPSDTLLESNLGCGSRKKYCLEVKDELDRRGIEYTLHESFQDMEERMGSQADTA